MMRLPLELKEYPKSHLPAARVVSVAAGVITLFLMGWWGVQEMTPSHLPQKGLWKPSPLAARATHGKNSLEQTMSHPIHFSAPQILNMMPLARNGLRSFTYIFEGKALYQGAPCPSASVLVRVSTPNGTQAMGGTTNADGSYH